MIRNGGFEILISFLEGSLPLIVLQAVRTTRVCIGEPVARISTLFLHQLLIIMLKTDPTVEEQAEQTEPTKVDVLRPQYSKVREA